MMRCGRVLRLAGVAGLLLATAPALSSRALAAQPAGQVLSTGEEVPLAAAGVELTPLRDGRVNSYGIAADVTGVAFTSHAGVGSQEVTAAPGDQLAVIGLSLAFPEDDDVGLAESAPAQGFTVTVSSGSVSARLSQLFFPAGGLGANSPFFAVAIPAGGPAVISVSCDGLTQQLDLRTGKRIGTVPKILYRAKTDPEVVVSPSATESFTATVATVGNVTGQFGVEQASLSYWVPNTTNFATPTTAILTLDFDASGIESGDSTTGPNPLPGSAFQVSADGQPVTLHSYSTSGTGGDLFSDFYDALVPANVRTVTVTIPAGTKGTAGVGPGYSSDQTAEPLTLDTALATTVTFPVPWQPAAGNATKSAAAAGQTKNHGSSGSFPWPAPVAAVVVLAVAAVLWARRHRSYLPARPVTWPPKGLPAGATAVLTQAPRAIGPGRVIDVADTAAGSTEAPASEQPSAEQPPAELLSVGQPVTGPPPPDAPPVKLLVKLLGPPDIEGLVQPIRRSSVRRALIVLVLTPERALSTDELAMAVSDHPDRDPKTQSVHSYVSILRRSLPPALLPDAGPAGYRLDSSGLVVDWAALASAAAENPNTPGWTDRARGALELVRGRPLAGALWEGAVPLVRVMEATVERLAHTLSAHLMEEGDPAGAGWAAERGLVAVTGSVGLWEDRLVAASAGSGYGLERAWSDAQDDLGADVALLASRYQQLRRQVGQDQRKDRPAAST